MVSRAWMRRFNRLVWPLHSMTPIRRLPRVTASSPTPPSSTSNLMIPTMKTHTVNSHLRDSSICLIPEGTRLPHRPPFLSAVLQTPLHRVLLPRLTSATLTSHHLFQAVQSPSQTSPSNTLMTYPLPMISAPMQSHLGKRRRKSATHPPRARTIHPS